MVTQHNKVKTFITFIYCGDFLLFFFHIQAVLETIRDLMNTDCLVPSWIHDIFLGYDDPSAANYKK